MPGQFNPAVVGLSMVHSHCMNSNYILKWSDICWIQRERKLTKRYCFYIHNTYLRRALLHNEKLS